MYCIAVSGTPGTGKTTLAKELCLSHDFLYVDVLALVRKGALPGSYNRAMKTYDIDISALSRYFKTMILKLKKMKKYEGIVIDSHLSHYLSPTLIDLVLVTHCDLKTLRQRLKKRNYSLSKIRDNLEAEAFETCLIEAQENGHRTVKVET